MQNKERTTEGELCSLVSFDSAAQRHLNLKPFQSPSSSGSSVFVSLKRRINKTLLQLSLFVTASSTNASLVTILIFNTLLWKISLLVTKNWDRSFWLSLILIVVSQVWWLYAKSCCDMEAKQTSKDQLLVQQNPNETETNNYCTNNPSFPSYSSPGGIHSLLFSPSSVVETATATTTASSSSPVVRTARPRSVSFCAKDTTKATTAEKDNQNENENSSFILSLLVGEGDSSNPHPTSCASKQETNILFIPPPPRSAASHGTEHNTNMSLLSGSVAAAASILAFGSDGGDTVTVEGDGEQSSIQGNNKNDPTDTSIDCQKDKVPLEPATLIYHESARSIVFRDHLRRSYINKDKEQRMASRTKSSASSLGTTRTSMLGDESDHSRTQPVPPLSTRSKGSRGGNTTSNNNMKGTSLDISERSRRSRGGSQSNMKGTSLDISERSRRSRGGSQSNMKGTSLDISEHSVSSIDTSVTSINGEVMSASARDFRSSVSGDGNGKDRGSIDDSKPQVIIANYTPEIEPLPILNLSPHHEFEPLLSSAPYVWDANDGPEKATKHVKVWEEMTVTEREVAELFQHQMCLVKTVKNVDWSDFLQKFKVEEGKEGGRWLHPQDLKSASKEARRKGFVDLPDKQFPFHSFPTSTTLLPACGTKMRCYGSTREYNIGVVFALPKEFEEGVNEEKAASASHTWCWPSGYSAKTEYNISAYGELINGRKEALVSIESLREMNHSYLYEKDYELAGRLVKGGLNIIPYNELLVRVGGLGRIDDTTDIVTEKNDYDGTSNCSRSFETGLGLPIALFVRTATYHDLIAMLRLRARMVSILGAKHMLGIPLLYFTPENGLRVLTESLQKKLLHIMSNELNPFQNPSLRRATQMENTSEKHMEQKLQELLSLDDDNIRAILTPGECAKLAGGFGATDDSVAHLLMDAMVEDFEQESTNEEIKQTRLQDLVNEGLAAAVRSGDYNTSRQLLILYTLVVSRGQQERERAKSMFDSADRTKTDEIKAEEDQHITPNRRDALTRATTERLSSRKLTSASSSSSVMTNYQHKDTKGEEDQNITPNRRDALTRATTERLSSRKLTSASSSPSVMTNYQHKDSSSSTLDSNDRALKESNIPPPPPPPPLDTDRLRSATNSDGLLAVLGAAEVLKSMQNNDAKKRATEAAQTIEEWVEKSEKSVAYRLASWRDQTAAQGDLKINTEANSNFMAFISNKAILNRKQFAQQLRDSVSKTNFESIDFLKSIHAMVSSMHSPCLRLELLQFILGLDNRYSVAHVARSVELAATCLNISAYEAMQANQEFLVEFESISKDNL